MKAKRTALVHFSVDNLILVDENKVSAIEFCFFLLFVSTFVYVCVRVRENGNVTHFVVHSIDRGARRSVCISCRATTQYILMYIHIISLNEYRYRSIAVT